MRSSSFDQFLIPHSMPQNYRIQATPCNMQKHYDSEPNSTTTDFTSQIIDSGALKLQTSATNSQQ